MDIRHIINTIHDLETDVNQKVDVLNESSQVNEMPLFKMQPSPTPTRQVQKPFPQFVGLPRTPVQKDINMYKWMEKYTQLRKMAKTREIVQLVSDLVANSDELKIAKQLLTDPNSSSVSVTQLLDTLWPRVAAKYEKWATGYRAKHPKSMVPLKVDRFTGLKKPGAIESYVTEFDNILSECIKL